MLGTNCKTAFTLLGKDIPVIGPRLKNREEAVKLVQYYIKTIGELSADTKSPRRLIFINRGDGYYTLAIEIFSTREQKHLVDLDELMLHRFWKAFKNGFVVLTSFVEAEDGRLECLALTDGLGAVLCSV